jgi:hypothetical protein
VEADWGSSRRRRNRFEAYTPDILFCRFEAYLRDQQGGTFHGSGYIVFSMMSLTRSNM